MTKQDVQKIAQEYVMKHKEHHKAVSKKEIDKAVEKVAKALNDLAVKEPAKNARKQSA